MLYICIPWRILPFFSLSWLSLAQFMCICDFMHFDPLPQSLSHLMAFNENSWLSWWFPPWSPSTGRQCSWSSTTVPSCPVSILCILMNWFEKILLTLKSWKKRQRSKGIWWRVCPVPSHTLKGKNWKFIWKRTESQTHLSHKPNWPI